MSEKKKGTIAMLSGIFLRIIGKEKFDNDGEGKSILTSEDKAKLEKEGYSLSLLEKFETALDFSGELEEQEQAQKAVIEQIKSENAAEMEQMTQKLNAAIQRATDAEAKVSELEKTKANLQETIEVLSDSADNGLAAERILNPGANKIEMGKEVAWNGVKANRKSFHNQMAFEYLEQGNSAKLVTAQANDSFNYAPKASGDTINTDELVNEFGQYMSQFKIELEIKKLLTQPTESQKYMTTKMAIKSWKASKAKITSVVQQFIAIWTPLGKSIFNPIEIINRRHKINVPITPNDITDGWLTYLYQEETTPDKMPITRYIIEQLLRPAIENDIELKLIATGIFEELDETQITTGSAGQATGKSMDGYLTILKAIKNKVDNAANFFDPATKVAGWAGAITDDNVLDVIDAYAKWVKDVAPLYHAKGLNLLIDPEIVDKYNYKYRDVFSNTKNQDGERKGPDFSKLTFVPLEAMRGSGIFFATPTDNFIRLIHTNEAGAGTNLQLQVQDYTVKIFGEFWLATGFALEELIFAYVPETETSGSGA